MECLDGWMNGMSGWMDEWNVWMEKGMKGLVDG